MFREDPVGGESLHIHATLPVPTTAAITALVGAVLCENPHPAAPTNLPPSDDTLPDPMGTLTSPLIAAHRALLRARTDLALENLALRRQLAIDQRDQKRHGFELVTVGSGSCSEDSAPAGSVRWSSSSQRPSSLGTARASSCSGSVSQSGARSAGPAWPAGTSPSSNASRAIVPSGETTRSPKSSPPSSARATPPTPSVASLSPTTAATSGRPVRRRRWSGTAGTTATGAISIVGCKRSWGSRDCRSRITRPTPVSTRSDS